MRKFLSKLIETPTAVAILVLAAVILIEGEQLNKTLDGLDDPFFQHDIRLQRHLLP